MTKLNYDRNIVKSILTDMTRRNSAALGSLFSFAGALGQRANPTMALVEQTKDTAFENLVEAGEMTTKEKDKFQRLFGEPMVAALYVATIPMNGVAAIGANAKSADDRAKAVNEAMKAARKAALKANPDVTSADVQSSQTIRAYIKTLAERGKAASSSEDETAEYAFWELLTHDGIKEFVAAPIVAKQAEADKEKEKARIAAKNAEADKETARIVAKHAAPVEPTDDSDDAPGEATPAPAPAPTPAPRVDDNDDADLTNILATHASRMSAAPRSDATPGDMNRKLTVQEARAQLVHAVSTLHDAGWDMESVIRTFAHLFDAPTPDDDDDDTMHDDLDELEAEISL